MLGQLRPGGVAAQLPQGSVHTLGGIAFEGGNHVRIRVQSDADTAVAQDFHDDAGADALGQEKRRTRMPKVMKPLIGEPSMPQDSLELPGNIPWL